MNKLSLELMNVITVLQGLELIETDYRIRKQLRRQGDRLLYLHRTLNQFATEQRVAKEGE